MKSSIRLTRKPVGRWPDFSPRFTAEETETLKGSVIWEAWKELIEQAGVASRTKAVTVFQSPSERGLDFRVPQLAVMAHGELVLF
ncbi:MAG: hypothetical protein K9N23_07630 [Akkermansiaceae bacterium]|nr:hypothetical protein [Akkermansiaceae bacterium]